MITALALMLAVAGYFSFMNKDISDENVVAEASAELLQEEYEIIFVNDGSRDATKEILNELAAKDSRVKACHFSRNFGQQAALLCGLQEASGQAVIAMDADLQDPPGVALEMIAKWKEGFDVVHGKRRKRK